MNTRIAHQLWSRPIRWDCALTLNFNRWAHQSRWRYLFIAASKLGDGPFWIACILILPWLNIESSSKISLHLAIVSLLAVGIYKLVKRQTKRLRPFARDPRILALTPALDQYSFPSGHTMHATAFSIVGLHYFPALAMVMIPFGVLIGLSRVVLGLHYPSDVLMGFVIGAIVAVTSLQWV